MGYPQDDRLTVDWSSQAPLQDVDQCGVSTLGSRSGKMYAMTNPLRRQADLLDEIFSAARRHGQDSEPEHEVGDLQDALSVAWNLLTPAQQQQVYEAHFRDHDRWLR
jgi:hypothetical protein